jgi:hypothetical protein
VTIGWNAQKIFDGLGAPAGIEKQFSGTFLATILGVDAAWTILGILSCSGWSCCCCPYGPASWISGRGGGR